MAKLALNLLKYSLDNPVANAAVVTILQVADARGRFPESPFEHAVPIPAGTTSPLVLDVPEGRFTLTARMPSGATDRKTTWADADGTRMITFDTGHSAHEWLSWQTLAGSVPPMTSFEKRGASPKLSPQKIWRPLSSATKGLADFIANVQLPSRDQTRPSFADVQLARGRLTFQGMQIKLAPPSLNLQPLGDEPSAEGWQINSNGYHRRGGPETKLNRLLAIVQSANVRAVVLLPLPWAYKLPESLALSVPEAARYQEHFAAADLLFDHATDARRAIRMTLREPEFVALLSYLGAGRFWEATAALGGPCLDDHVTQLIHDKIENPLAAAGAAYVGLATSGDETAREKWAPWLRNLMDWFPDLPDGAVLFARDRIDRGRTAADLMQAKEALKTAYRRGIPLYVAGLQNLLNGLQLFSDPEADDLFDTEAKGMREQVATVAALVDATQPFTVLTLQGPSI